MSGGSHDYACYKLEEIADSFWQEETRTHLEERKKVSKILKLMSKICHDIEWIDSGDCGEDDWINIKKMLDKIKL